MNAPVPEEVKKREKVIHGSGVLRVQVADLQAKSQPGHCLNLPTGWAVTGIADLS